MTDCDIIGADEESDIWHIFSNCMKVNEDTTVHVLRLELYNWMICARNIKLNEDISNLLYLINTSYIAILHTCVKWCIEKMYVMS